ncbi:MULTISPECIES: type VI secretion system protein TssL, short form [unclassified Pantoea]|jgi:type VI secretion system protein ImpK|uniref:type VI secretion system protein TssL, short form n=1 Tax=unclassified Pantoea TaxID=2630326 RepID=UPI0024531D83|nr:MULTISPECIES: type VI secretion system protein TssL, short form [unclassified Pantoea]MDR6350059.1 type VI secretion system protein ImpK [Pantoea sp. SORGH_AS_0659]WGK55784.1 type VI secretion system protein TssL, short form [Pantoea sp. SS70]
MNSNNALTERLFFAGWLMVSQLRCGQQIDNGDALYRRATDWVNDARQALTEAGFSEANRDHMLYAFCVLLDEAVLNRGQQDDGWLRWSRDPLQVRFFNSLNGGEALWERIRELLREPAADETVLTCLYRTLQLGFVGHYRAQDDERREDVVRELAARVPPFALAQDAPLVVRPAGMRTGRRFYWMSWVAAAVLLGGLWFVLDGWLAQMVSGISGMGK